MKNMKFHLHSGLVAKQIRICELTVLEGDGNKSDVLCIFHFDFH